MVYIIFIQHIRNIAYSVLVCVRAVVAAPVVAFHTVIPRVYKRCVLKVDGIGVVYKIVEEKFVAGGVVGVYCVSYQAYGGKFTNYVVALDTVFWRIHKHNTGIVTNGIKPVAGYVVSKKFIFA
jgi:hypothetical protein